jgi:HK97 family phage prohead protease
MSLHPKIKALKLRAAPINYRNVSVNARGQLTTSVQDDLDKRIIQGYLITWGTVNDYGEKCIKGCCAKSIQERGPNSSSKYKITFLWQHDCRDPLSLFAELVEDDYGLRFKTLPLDDVPNADRAIKQIRSGTLNQFSVGFDYIWDKVEWDSTDDSLVLKEIDLYEGSVVTLAADSETFAMRSSINLEEEKMLLNEEIEDFIKTIPRKQQLELRQLITRHKSLAIMEPLELRQAALDKDEPAGDVLDYKLLLTDLKLF